MAPPFLIVAADLVKTGGMDRANFALAEWLAKQGNEVQVVAHGVGRGLQGVSNLHWQRVRRPLGSDALGWGALARQGRRAARRVASAGGHVLVNGGNCAWRDINWVHYVHAAYAAPAPGGLARQLWHGYKHRRALADEAQALRQARVIIANSERTRQDLISRVGVEAGRIEVVYYGCDAIQFSEVTPEMRHEARRELGWREAGTTALFVGALGDRRKGFDTLLATWQRLCARPEWTMDLAVVGRGGELASWRERAAALGARCQFLGFRRDVPRLLAASSLLISPTRYEAYGLGVHEALARGVPALVSAQAGVAERYPKTLASLLLGDPDSPLELEQKLWQWHEDAARLQPAVATLGAELRSFSWDAMACDLLAACERHA